MALRLIPMMGYEVCVERMPVGGGSQPFCVRTCGCIVRTLLCGCSVFLGGHVRYVVRGCIDKILRKKYFSKNKM
jgi:hypothetical protein